MWRRFQASQSSRAENPQRIGSFSLSSSTVRFVEMPTRKDSEELMAAQQMMVDAIFGAAGTAIQ
jgi:hypothetical protein